MNVYEIIGMLKAKKNKLLGFNNTANEGYGLLSVEKIKENPIFYAKKFSEGDKQLETFLLKCFENNIYTRACCAGHNSFLGVKKHSYVSFDNINKNYNQINAMINKLYSHDGVTFEFGSISGVPFENLYTNNCIALRFDKSKNKIFYKLMSEAIDQENDNSLPLEIEILYNICFANKLSYFLPDVEMTMGEKGKRTLKFSNSLLCLNKDYIENLSNDFENLEYEERLGFNKHLSDIGFKRNCFNWEFQSNSQIDILNKLESIYMWTSKEELENNFDVDKIIFFNKELALYYNDYYNATIDTQLSYNQESLILSVSAVNKQRNKKTLLYLKKFLYNEEVEQNICIKFIESIINNYKPNEILMTFCSDILNINYGTNSLFIDIPNLNDVYFNTVNEHAKTI